MAQDRLTDKTGLTRLARADPVLTRCVKLKGTQASGAFLASRERVLIISCSTNDLHLSAALAAPGKTV
jgi:hypothetical protein